MVNCHLALLTASPKVLFKDLAPVASAAMRQINGQFYRFWEALWHRDPVHRSVAGSSGAMLHLARTAQSHALRCNATAMRGVGSSCNGRDQFGRSVFLEGDMPSEHSCPACFGRRCAEAS